VAAVHAVLRASQAPWLLVFDNAPDRASVVPFAPPAGPGRVLITSRNQIWPPGQAVEVPASGRSIAEYLGLFRTRRAELLGRGDPAGNDKRVTTTWALAFAGLGGAGPAAGLLRLVACCGRGRAARRPAGP
jgi:hypothetical protein